MEKWLIWCDLNSEQDALEVIFGNDCVSIRGNTPIDRREEMERDWREGDVPILITKPSLFGFGLNWQHCSNMVFVGLSDSYEMYYQAKKRIDRYGQTKEVHIHIITSNTESAVLSNIQRKERDAQRMADEMVSHMQVHNTEAVHGTRRRVDSYNANKVMIIPNWL